MSTAKQIQATARNANDACNAAESTATSIDQDWDNEATIYSFEDGSVLYVSGPTVTAYANRDQADAENPAN